MNPSLPRDIQTEIFSYLLDPHHMHVDKLTLYSCMNVNKSWCEIAVRYLWSDTANFISHPKAVTILLSFIPDESKELLRQNGIPIKRLSKPPLFNYPTFCKTLTISHVGYFWKFEEEDIVDHNYKVHLITQELYKLFISKSPIIKKLTLLTHSIHLTHFPGANSSLSQLVEFMCDTNLSHDSFYGMAQICKHLKKLIVKQYHEDNQALSKLIKSQHNLTHVEIDTECDFNSDDFSCPNIGHALTEVAQSIRHLSLGGSQQCILMHTVKHFNNLRSFRLAHYGDYVDEMLEHMNREYFPNLGIFEVDYEAPKLSNLTRFILNNNTNLEEISLYCTTPPDPKYSTRFNKAVAQKCRKLEFFTSFFADTEFNDLKDILINCTNLKALYVRSANNRLNGDKLLEILRHFASPQLSRLCIGGDWEFGTKELEEFLEFMWKKEGRPISIYHHYENIIDEEKEEAFEFSDEQVEIIKRYQMSDCDLDLIRLKEVFSCEWNPFYYDFSKYYCATQSERPF